MAIPTQGAKVCMFGPAFSGDDAASMNVEVQTQVQWKPLFIYQAPTAFNLNLSGGDFVDLVNLEGSAAMPPVAIEWKLHGGIWTGKDGAGCYVFDDREVAWTITVLKKNTINDDGNFNRSGNMVTIEGGNFNAYLLRARVVSIPVRVQANVSLFALRAPSSGGGVTVQVGGFTG